MKATQKPVLRAKNEPLITSSGGASGAGGAKEETACLREPQIPAAYYLPESSYLVEDARGEYVRLNQGNFILHLRKAGISRAKPDGAHTSPVEDIIYSTQRERSLAYAGPYAGHKKGLHEVEGNRILATSSPTVIDPAPGVFPIITGIINGLLCPSTGETIQREVFIGWLQIAYKCLVSGNHRPGQVLCIAGPRECGKSLLQFIITLVLGGRSAHPFSYLTGATDFNRDLFGAEHQVIGDQAYASDNKSRRLLGAGFKGIAAEDSHRCHPKNRDAFTMKPFWRLTVSCNDEPERLMVLPPMDDDIVDKIILLKAGVADIPPELRTDRRKMQETLARELPAFIYYVSNFNELPTQYLGGRFGIRYYHHPDLLQAVHELSPEASLLQMIDRCSITSREGILAADIEDRLKDDESPVRRAAQALLSHSNTCGAYLSRLSKNQPDRVAKMSIVNGHQRWRINPAASTRSGLL